MPTFRIHKPTPLMRRLIASFAWDWGFLLLIYILFLGLNLVHPFQRYFFADDESISYPYRQNDTIPMWLLFIIAFVVPLGVIAIFSLTFRFTAGASLKYRKRDLHQAMLGLFLAIGVTALLTEIIKNAVGRLRPDFLSRCQPEPDVKFSPSCRGDLHIVNEGRKSFPSGHSSFAFAGLGFLFFYLAGKLKLWDYQGHVWKVILTLLPLVAAILVAISRVDDYRHHWQDVTIGGLIGFVDAYFSYRFYYPELNSKEAGEPYSDRFDRLKSTLPGNIALVSGGPMSNRISPSSTPEIDLEHQ